MAQYSALSRADSCRQGHPVHNLCPVVTTAVAPGRWQQPLTRSSPSASTSRKVRCIHLAWFQSASATCFAGNDLFFQTDRGAGVQRRIRCVDGIWRHFCRSPARTIYKWSFHRLPALTTHRGVNVMITVAHVPVGHPSMGYREFS